MKRNLKQIVNLIIKIIGYTVILMATALLFKNTIYIDNSNYGLWCLLAAIFVYLLNLTLKPFLVWLTIPITGITLGLFYPFIILNIFKLVSLILKGHFIIYGIWYAVLASILISVMNIVFDELILKKIGRD